MDVDVTYIVAEVTSMVVEEVDGDVLSLTLHILLLGRLFHGLPHHVLIPLLVIFNHDHLLLTKGYLDQHPCLLLLALVMMLLTAH